ncbi:MAG TPA: ATP-binding protein [Ramlibacter sp.]|jgi:PAS domain S-box-containing protein|uniref:ATP-binding protein n=1 Tax=Ramlibacter sp. TaxID=1917967 RepID=UPI002D70A6FB|nr:ATP-binding protein [Ramlibacter sp.]HZY19333.1 ATP-binding protein [Ramlibacter sp.]
MKLLQTRSIRSKLHAILAATTLTALLVAASALLFVELRRELDDTRDDLATQADVIALASSPALTFGDPHVAAENLAVLRARRNVTAAALYDATGGLFATYEAEPGRVEFPPKALAPGVTVKGDWAVAWRPVLANREQVGTVYVQMQHDRVQAAFATIGMLVLVMGGSLVAALLLSNRLQRALTGPILDVSEVARKILRGETADLRARKVSEDEVGDLVDAFNAMLDELGRRARTLEAANQALRMSEARYQLAVRGSSAGLWDWDMPAGTMFYSPRFKGLLGYAQDDFPDVPGSIEKVLHPDDRGLVHDGLRAHLRHGQPFQVECRLRDSSGRWRWFFVAGAALRDPAGQAFRMAGSVVEVTERKEAERVLQDANRAKDEFIATLAHELRNPLAPIRTGLEILKKDKANGPLSDRTRATMERQLTHMIRLIDDLLDISRINSGKIRLEIARIPLRPVVDSALEISRPAVAAAGHSLDVDVPEDDIHVMGDPTRLAQALGNLLNNAAKYTPAGGRIALRLRREGAWAAIEVEDNGEGIPPDMLESIFSLFAQVRSSMDRAQGGLGIGLYLVRSLVALHGGTVAARSPGPGRGSVFTMRLPCLPSGALALTEPPAAGAAEAPSGLKVLLVDDNVDAAETLGQVLEMADCQVRLVHDGTQVLAAAREFRPDVALLDIGLPGLNGYEVAALLRREPQFAGMRIIAITGWGAEQDRRRAQEAGFDHHLTKPVDFSALEPLLRRALPPGETSPAR